MTPNLISIYGIFVPDILSLLKDKLIKNYIKTKIIIQLSTQNVDIQTLHQPTSKPISSIFLNTNIPIEIIN